MKYRVLLKFLQILIYIKRFFWKVGAGLYFVIGLVAGSVTRLFLHIKLRIAFSLKKFGISQNTEWIWKRGFIQIIVLLVFFAVSLGQTKLVTKKDLSYVGQKTLVYVLAGASDEIQYEEETASASNVVSGNYSWRTGAIAITETGPASDSLEETYYLGAAVAGGRALTKPRIISGSISSAKRTTETSYVIERGDSLSSIAYKFGISVNTILWNNNLTLRSILKPGSTLLIPPVDGTVHLVKKGDTIAKIAKQYKAKTEDIVAFNNFKPNGSDMKVGERIIVPNGVRQTLASTVPSTARLTQSQVRGPIPQGSSSGPSLSGYVWPSAAKTITQYYGLRHHALDIAGPWQSANYAAKSGTVITSQCGWNSGYGCYIIIDHGGGVKTLYGHNSKLLVSVGDYVEAGQTIGLMGNTGKVRGATGIHLHFEIIVNGSRANPLRYVR